MYNGALECRLLTFPLRAPRGPRPVPEELGNRLRKRHRHLSRWAAKRGITCYRVYDADLPQYAVAIDLYEGWAVVQEYQAPPEVDPRHARTRLKEVLAAVPEVLGIPPDHVVLKVRRRQRGGAQVEPSGEDGALHEVGEGGHRFGVRLTGRLDTGLFLDGRKTRELVGRLAAGARFLNLFSYSGTATVYAARGGAVATTSVDLSRTYLERARHNLRLNGIEGPQHRLVRADCLRWLPGCRERFDLILVDPPTFSASKGMETTWEVQRDHPALLGAAGRLLAPEGVLLFCAHRRGFALDEAALAPLEAEEITAGLTSEDFRRRPSRHRVWRLRRTG